MAYFFKGLPYWLVSISVSYKTFGINEGESYLQLVETCFKKKDDTDQSCFGLTVFY